MNSETDHRAEGAVVMQHAATKAVAAAKAAMMKAIEDAIPNDGTPRNQGRQMGATITACSMIYADMLRTFVEHGGKGEAVLIGGILKDMIAEPLVALGQKTDGRFNLRVVPD